MNIFHHRQGKHQSSPPPPAKVIENPVKENPAKRSLTKSNSSSSRLNAEDRTKKNRKTINALLKHVGHQLGKGLTLCEKGICYFSYKQFLIVIEVPEESESFFIYAMVFRLGPGDDRLLVLQKCMELNYMQQATRGSTLGLERDEVSLCYSAAVHGVTKDCFQETLENFIVTVDEVNKRLQMAA